MSLVFLLLKFPTLNDVNVVMRAELVLVEHETTLIHEAWS